MREGGHICGTLQYNSTAGELTEDPPSCTLVAQWEGASAVQQLSYLVKLSGTNTPKFLYFIPR